MTTPIPGISDLSKSLGLGQVTLLDFADKSGVLGQTTVGFIRAADYLLDAVDRIPATETGVNR